MLYLLQFMIITEREPLKTELLNKPRLDHLKAKKIKGGYSINKPRAASQIY
jgi:hypothetical protein